MGKASEYRAQAVEHEALARLMSRHDDRDRLLATAASLRAMADAAEQEELAAHAGPASPFSEGR